MIGFSLTMKFTKMFRLKIERLLKEFGIKQEKLVAIINSDRGTFKKKMKDNSFSKEEQNNILDVYGVLL